ncbi:MAG: DUF1015 family protein [Ferruginibacter sp.]
MITIIPFKALRPEAQHAKAVASRPYDVLTSREAKIEAQGNPSSFLHITKSEIDLPESMNAYAPEVYESAKENLQAFISRKILFRENKPCYYLYRLTMNARSQTGIVCCSSLDDYDNGLIKKHEFTRPDKELDRINHMKITGAQTGNVFLTYKNNKVIDELVAKWTTEKNPQYDFVADDGVQHSIWIVSDDETIHSITNTFKALVPCTYIADGHHRAASASKVRASLDNLNAAYFLTTLFPSSEVNILDYNRVIKDLNGHTLEEFLNKAGEKFTIEKQSSAFKPARIHEFGLYIKKQWFSLVAKEGTFTEDPIGILDITILQENLLNPILGIGDQRTDKRIDFIGGIRGTEELENRVNSGEMCMAFNFYPVSIDQLINIADSENVMPPKSTWFEPKLRDGLLTHLFD